MGDGSRDNVDESMSTIKFAERARHIKTILKPNEIRATDSALIKKLMREIKYLRGILHLRRGGKGGQNTQIQKRLLLLQRENDNLR